MQILYGGVPFDFQVTDKSLSQMEQNSQIGPKMGPRCLFDLTDVK